MADAKVLTPEQKAAAVVVSMGVDKASEIYKHLSEEDLEKLTIEVARLNRITPEQTEEALDDFYKMCMTQKVVADGGYDYARTVLEKAFGEQAAQSLLARITKSLKPRPFEFIRKTDSKNLFAMLQHERPQTIALVLSYANSDQAAEIISELPPKKRISVTECIAKMDSASPEAIKVVETALEKQFSSVLTMDFAQIGGIDYIAEVMNYMDRSNEKMIFDELSQKDAALADEIRKRMFVFEDIITLDPRSVQRFVRDVDTKDLVYALKGANKEVANLIYANMSSRMAETVKSDLEITVNVRMREVEEAQQRIVNLIRELEEKGEVIINKGGKDEIIA